MKKYSMKKDKATGLYRVKALIDIKDSLGNIIVKKGEFGGLIEKEENLSHDESAQVSGNAQVYENAWIYGGVWSKSPLYIQGTKHALTNCAPGYIQIGCECRTFADWKKNFKQIGKANNYSNAEIEEYKSHILYIIKAGVK